MARINEAVAAKMKEQGYLWAAEISRRSGVNTSTIYDWINAGKLESKRVGIIHFVNVEEFLGVAGEGVRMIWEASKAEEPAEA